MAPAIYDNGIKSPDAETEPRNGTTGVIRCSRRLRRDSTMSEDTAEWPRSVEFDRTITAALTQDAGMAWDSRALLWPLEASGDCFPVSDATRTPACVS